MKNKRQKRKTDTAKGAMLMPNRELPPPLTIKFNINRDTLACFVGEKKNTKKRTQKRPNSTFKIKNTLS